MGISGVSDDNEYEVIVVGGGIMGSCAAYEFAKRGVSTLLLEQFDFLHNRGSSHGESRTLRLTYPEPYYTSLVLQASHLWEEAQSEMGYRVVYPTTHLDLGPSHDLSLQAAIANSPSSLVLLPHQLSHHFSAQVVVPEGWVGVLSDGAALIKPTKAVSMFQTLAFRKGAVLKDNIKVTNITRTTAGAILVSTATGQNIKCKKCVVTAGAWMKKLVEEVTGRHIPIHPVETTICYWRIKAGHEREYSIQGGFPTFASYGNPYIYGTPSMEYPGLIKIGVHGGLGCAHPEQRTWASLPELTEKLSKWVKERFEGKVEYENGPVSSQSCLYSMTPDEDYVIDFLGGELGKDVVIAGGFSGHGFKMGPAVGRVVADLLLHGDAPAVELSYFKLDRFQKSPKGNFKGFAEQVGLVSPAPPANSTSKL